MTRHNVSLPIPGHPEASFHVHGDAPLTPEASAALQRIMRAALAHLTAPPRRVSRRQQKRERVRLALLARRDRQRHPCEARMERADRDMYRAYDRMAEDCVCCSECHPGACDEVFQGAPCARLCDCDERARREDEYDDSDELDEGWGDGQ